MQKIIISDLIEQDKLHFEQANIPSFEKQNIEIHINHSETIYKYSSKISILLNQNVVLYIKRELQEIFDNLLYKIKSEFPFLFYSEVNVNYI